MPNAIKYNTGSETLALKKGNFWIGTGAVGKGPTETTGYYNGITPPSGGYTIYLNKASSGPAIYTVNNDSQLISLTNQIAGQSYTTVQQCFDYFYGQTDKLLVNQDYPSTFPYIVLDGLVLYLNAGISQSYGGSGTSWYDINGLGPKNNTTLYNSPSYSNGSIVFDGTDDYGESGVIEPSTLTLCALFKPTGEPSNNDSAGGTIIVNSPQLTNNAVQYAIAYSWLNQRVIFSLQSNNEFLPTPDNSVLRNQTHYIVATFDGTNRKIYINGVNVASDVRAVSPNYPTSGNRNVQIGRWGYPGYSRIINGNLYSVSMYNRALTAQEALQNYQSQIPQLIGENIVGNGLVLYLDAGYQPSYPTSGTTWYDISGNGNNGTLTNGPTFNSANGGSIVFDGTDDYAQTNSNSGISGSNPYTFEIFLNVNSSEIGSGRRGWFIWQGLGSQSTNQLIGLCVNNGSIEIAHWNNDTVYTNSIINFGNWQHIVTTYSSGTERIYINGVNTNTKSIGTLSIVNGKITLSGIAGDSSSVNTLNCQIGLHRIYNRELTAVEVLQNYNAQKGRFGL